MRFAVEFGYESDDELTFLSCQSSFDPPNDMVSPAKAGRAKVSDFAWTAELRGKSGTAFWTGYVLGDDLPDSSRYFTVCFSHGREALHYEFIVDKAPQ